MKEKYFTAKQIADIVDGNILGDGNRKIHAINFPEYAKSNEITYARTKKEIESTSAGVILTKPVFMDTDKTLIFYPYEIDEILDILIQAFIEREIYKDYSKKDNIHTVENNVSYGRNVYVGQGTYIEPFTFISEGVTIGDNCFIGSNVYIGSDVKIGNNVKVNSGAKVGGDSFYHSARDKYYNFCGIGSVVIGNGVEIGYNTIVQRGTLTDTIIEDDTIIGNLVDIGHDVRIGSKCKIVSQTGIAGNAKIGNYVCIYGQVGIANDVVIGNNVVVKAKTIISKNVADNRTISGLYGRDNFEELRIQARLRKLLNDERND